MPVSRGKKGVEEEMHRFKRGELKSGSGHKVTDRKQAIAIALKESGQSRKGKRGHKRASKRH